MDVPRTRYARSGSHHIAYQVVGEGPIDLLYVPTWISQVELLWEEPHLNRFFQRLASFTRLILFDRRGSGLSDPMVGAPTLEEQMDDVNAVLDATGSSSAALMAMLEGGPMAMLFAASYPERTRALALYTTFARATASDDVPWALAPAERAAMVEELVSHWGQGSRLSHFSPHAAQDSDVDQWYAKLERHSASPGTARAIMTLVGKMDVRAVLPTIRVPTLVMHRAGDPMIDPRHATYLAERIPGARLVVMPPGDTLPIIDGEILTGEIEEFLTGSRAYKEPDRVLATVLFTDIVDSTGHAAKLGDQRWRDLLERHDAITRGELARFRGREVKHTGDGIFATFDGPARAIRCAEAISDAVAKLGVEIRAGLHTGEVELRDEDVAGVAVHIGARVAAVAGGGEVLVSSTVKDLVAGSGIGFADRGSTELRGVPGEWRIFAVDR
jgi:class 3 adenylate cyclase/pimeloyl-ACP methyl ester carboxylesterase